MDTLARIVESWADPALADIQGDCMLRIAEGVHYHVRLATVIVVKSELRASVAAHLPTTATLKATVLDVKGRTITPGCQVLDDVTLLTGVVTDVNANTRVVTCELGGIPNHLRYGGALQVLPVVADLL